MCVRTHAPVCASVPIHGHVGTPFVSLCASVPIHGHVGTPFVSLCASVPIHGHVGTPFVSLCASVPIHGHVGTPFVPLCAQPYFVTTCHHPNTCVYAFVCACVHMVACAAQWGYASALHDVPFALPCSVFKALLLVRMRSGCWRRGLRVARVWPQIKACSRLTPTRLQPQLPRPWWPHPLALGRRLGVWRPLCAPGLQL